MAATALIVAPAASVAEPEPDYVDCSFKVKKKVRVSAATKRGLPVKITCERPTEVIAALDLKFGSKQEYKWMLLHGDGIPGISNGSPVKLQRTAVARARLTPEAGRFLQRYRRSGVYVHVAAQHPEHPERYRDAADRRLVTFLGKGRR